MSFIVFSTAVLVLASLVLTLLAQGCLMLIRSPVRRFWRRVLYLHLGLIPLYVFVLIPGMLGLAGSRFVQTRGDESGYGGPRLNADGHWLLQCRGSLDIEEEGGENHADPATLAEARERAVHFRSKNGVLLRAFHVRARGQARATVILVHGLFRGSMEVEPVGKMFHELGAEVLILELSNHGGSSRMPATYGLRESEDILAAAEWLRARPEGLRHPLILFSVSLGTAAVGLAAPKIPELAGLVLDAPMTELLPTAHRALGRIEWRGKQGMGLPRVFVSLTLTALELWSGFEMAAVRPIDAYGKLPPNLPSLMIGGGLDYRMPPPEVRKAYAALRAPGGVKELWIRENSGHGKVWVDAPVEYEEHLARLLERVAGNAVGERQTGFENPTEQGSKELEALVYYPAKTDGRNAELVHKPGGHPVLVFLHGFGTRAILTRELGQQLAAHGYITVLSDTALIAPNLQSKDGRALYHALVRENERQGAFFEGQLDMDRAGLCGHSMGAGNTIRILAENPGYKAGFCFANWDGRVGRRLCLDYVPLYAEKVQTPLGMVHGLADRSMPWQETSLRYYEAMRSHKSLRFLYLLDEKANHYNICAPTGRWYRKQPQPPDNSDKEVFALSVGLATAFFDRFLKQEKKALESFLGAGAEKRSLLLRCYQNTKKQVPKAQPNKDRK